MSKTALCPIRCAFMIKRSQNKTRFSSDNYKKRWFVLTNESLNYYDGTEQYPNYDKMKGSITLSQVKNVEFVDDISQFNGQKGSAFQVAYADDDVGGQSTHLYIISPGDEERADWVQRIQAECQNIASCKLDPKYHPRIWSPSTRKWACCEQPCKYAPGCRGRPRPRQKYEMVIPQQQEEGLHCDGYNDHRPLELTRSDASNASSSSRSSNWSDDSGVMSEYPIAPIPSGTRKKSADLHQRNISPRCSPTTGSPVSGMRSRPPPQIPQRPSAPPRGNQVYVVKHSYQARQHEDLDVEKGEECEVLIKAPNWWKVRTDNGTEGYVPATYLIEKGNDPLGLTQYEWYYNESREYVESLLSGHAKEGCFVVRPSQQDLGKLTVSLYCVESAGTEREKGHVKHYHIKKDDQGQLHFAPRHAFTTVPELIEYHKHDAGGLHCRLKCPPSNTDMTADIAKGFEIDHDDLILNNLLGQGEFGEVYQGIWRGSDVAVKVIKEKPGPGCTSSIVNRMSEDSFIEEAKTMMTFIHPNLVRIFGICMKPGQPIKIVTEFVAGGALLDHLKNNHRQLQNRQLLPMCVDVCHGMAHLESRNLIHRDLAARNCLITGQNMVKVTDFGMARHVPDNEYTAGSNARFPIRWSSLEVLEYQRFSNKSDVWSFGVCMWEIFSGGTMPYKGMKHEEVVERVSNAYRLPKPSGCPQKVYDVMYSCWIYDVDKRPSFSDLKEHLQPLLQQIR